ncbi:MAG: VWA domain-containing protein, partial [Pirellulales bacterium]|nr:VWA domain-containing protein [Pirellulales bacterium]
MLNITLQHGFSVWTMLAVAVVAVGLAGWFYRRAFGALRPWQRWTLFGLRALAIGLVVLLLFRPVLSYTESLEERSALVVLLDTSASMSIADDPSGATRLDQARRQIEAWREKLDNLFDFHLVAFSDQARPVDDPRTLPTLAADSKATSLTAALRAGAAQAPAESIEALILLSDGQHNTA